MDFLRHYGTPRHSGRYPWGSGDEPFQNSDSIISRVDGYRRKGFSEKEAAEAVGMSIAAVRAQRSLEKAEKTASDVAMAQRLKAKGMSFTAIGERMGRNESSIRSLLAPERQERVQITKNTTEMLRKAIGKDAFVDIGAGIDAQLGISDTRLKTAAKALQNEGYEIINVQVPQLGTDRKTTVKVLAPPGTTYKDVVTNMSNIRLPQEHSIDGGRTFSKLKPPVNISSKRIDVAYASDKDGLIELRREAQDLSLNGKRYAQVRIGVDGTHFLKGMAIHADDLPPGVDILFHTSKMKTEKKEEAFKKVSDDPLNPFTSSITQFEYTDKFGNSHQSPLNVVGSEKSPNVEGRWGEWSRTLSSQVLAKQPPSLAERQLGLLLKAKEDEYNELNNLTNPAVKRRLLNTLADDCDSAANTLKAAALPRQMSHVILPITTMPEHQVYAPRYRHGETVVVIRHPHGGKFEIPELIVNNNHRDAKRILGQANDAIGIHPNVAKRMSGADFDGDAVLVIPNPRGKNKIQTSKPLKDLVDFDPITRYPHVEGMKVMTPTQKQAEMGNVSNLITDMTIKGASPHEIAQAVRHSMVVIDAEKHKLNYKLSAIDNGIPQLKEKYQGRTTAGASTIVSLSRAEVRVPKRKEGQLIGPASRTTGKPTRIYVDPKTGKKLYEPTGETYINKAGKEVKKTDTLTKMEVVDDAHQLSSGTTIETIYANHANALKRLANNARKDSVNTKNIAYSPEARRKFSKEVESLGVKLKAARANKPLERKAQILANDIVAAKRKSNPGLSKDDLRKVKGRALEDARNRVGANKPAIIISPLEWSAIQSGAIKNSFLEQVIQNSDIDVVRSLATPRKKSNVTASKIAKIQALNASGYLMSEIAQQVGLSTTTINRILNS